MLGLRIHCATNDCHFLGGTIGFLPADTPPSPVAAGGGHWTCIFVGLGAGVGLGAADGLVAVLKREGIVCTNTTVIAATNWSLRRVNHASYKGLRSIAG